MKDSSKADRRSKARAVNRYSRTVEALRRPSTFEGLREYPREEWEKAFAQDPGFIPRLSWRSGPRVPTDWTGLIAALSAEHELAVFCDNSAFDDSAPEELWDALLREPGRLVLTERVNAELRSGCGPASITLWQRP